MNAFWRYTFGDLKGLGFVVLFNVIHIGDSAVGKSVQGILV